MNVVKKIELGPNAQGKYGQVIPHQKRKFRVITLNFTHLVL